MALDNPSYFSSFGFPARLSLFRRKRKDSTSSESSAAPSTPGCNRTNKSTEYLYDANYQHATILSPGRRHRAPLARSALALLTGGEPRPEDREPDCPWPDARSGSLPGRNRDRRHSITGSFSKRTLSSSSSDYIAAITSVPDGAPRKTAPKVPKSPLMKTMHYEDLPFRQRLKAVMANHDPSGIILSRPDVIPRDTLSCRRNKGAYGRLNMDDILLLSSRDSNAAALWVDYLTTCFDQITRGKTSAKIRVFPLCAEDLPKTPCPELVRRIRSAKLLIIVLCPRLLQRCCKDEPEDVVDGLSALTTRMSADRVVAAMLGVKDCDVKEEHHKALTCYDHWTRLEVRDQDQNFVGCLLSTSMTIIGSPGQEEAVDQVDCAVDASDLQDDAKAAFCLQPKKVRYGQSRIIALLNDPAGLQDSVEVFVERNESGEMVKALQIRRRNPYTVQFTVPDICMSECCLLSIQLRINGRSMGSRPVKCEARSREFERVLRECLERPDGLWGLLGLPGSVQDRDRLDAALCRALRENMPQDFQLLAASNVDDLGCTGLIPECPSLLHFCARYGLERTALRLLDCPGGAASGTSLDSAGRSPAELATHYGHHRLASVLQGYMQMNELSSMYAYLKGISGARRTSSRTSESHDTSADTMGYLDMTTSAKQRTLNNDNNTDDSMSEQCCRLLEEDGPRASCDGLTSEEEKSTRSISRATNDSQTSYGDYANACASPEADYCLQPSNIPVSASLELKHKADSINSLPNTNPFTSTTTINSPFADYLTHPSNLKVYPGHLHQPASVKADVHRQSSSSSDDKSPDEELAELIKDFRRGAKGLAEVEQLAEQWRARHATRGAQTQRERDRMLKSMREQYDKLQKQGDGKKGALERVRRLFARTKHVKDTENKQQQEDSHKVIRPMSSMSIHSVSSSSSSGRLSTGSVCSGASLGDSGTHSDNEDRKISLKHLSMDTTRKQQQLQNLDNYLIPPAPRPLLLPIRSNIEKFTSPSGQEHYIRFPPSNQPVGRSNSNQTPPLTPVTPQTPPLFSSMDYGNLPAAPLNTIQEAREYVNFRTAAG